MTGTLQNLLMSFRGARPVKHWSEDIGMFHAIFDLEAVAADTWYILVDLSDTTNFKHPACEYLVIHSITAIIETESGGVFDIFIGPVVENDATDGSAKGILKIQRETNSPAYVMVEKAFPGGLKLKLTSGALDYVVSNLNQADKTNLQNDAANLTSPGASSLSAGVGDLMMLIDEISDVGTMDIFVDVAYTVE